MKRPMRKKSCATLHQFLYENYGEIEFSVGYGVDIDNDKQKCLHVLVTRGKKHMDVIPEEWEGWPVKARWIGKVKPL